MNFEKNQEIERERKELSILYFSLHSVLPSLCETIQVFLTDLWDLW